MQRVVGDVYQRSGPFGILVYLPVQRAVVTGRNDESVGPGLGRAVIAFFQGNPPALGVVRQFLVDF